jgi:hypothetical protein
MSFRSSTICWFLFCLSATSACQAEHPTLSAQAFLRQQIADIAFDRQGNFAVWTDLSLMTRLSVRRDGRCMRFSDAVSNRSQALDIENALQNSFNIARGDGFEEIRTNNISPENNWYQPCDNDTQTAYIAPRKDQIDQFYQSYPIPLSVQNRSSRQTYGFTQTWLSYVTSPEQFRAATTSEGLGQLHQFGQGCAIVVNREPAKGDSLGSASFTSVTAIILETEPERREPIGLKIPSGSALTEDHTARPEIQFEGQRCIQRALAFSFGAYGLAAATDEHWEAIAPPGSITHNSDEIDRMQALDVRMQRTIALLRPAAELVRYISRNRTQTLRTPITRSQLIDQLNAINLDHRQQENCNDYSRVINTLDNPEIYPSDFHMDGQQIYITADCRVQL